MPARCSCATRRRSSRSPAASKARATARSTSCCNSAAAPGSRSSCPAASRYRRRSRRHQGGAGVLDVRLSLMLTERRATADIERLFFVVCAIRSASPFRKERQCPSATSPATLACSMAAALPSICQGISGRCGEARPDLCSAARARFAEESARRTAYDCRAAIWSTAGQRLPFYVRSGEQCVPLSGRARRGSQRDHRGRHHDVATVDFRIRGPAFSQVRS